MNNFHGMSKAVDAQVSEILTVEEVAIYLKVTQRSVYNLLSKKKLPAFRVGGAWRFRRDEIEAMTRGDKIIKKGKAKK